MLVGSELEFRLQDQGIGVRTIVNGFGLKTMRERVEQLGGSLTVDSRPGQGCLLRINLPYQKQWIGEKEWKKSRL
ncbi:ATP-binding protein [Paenibacillus sp. BR1-192]|uniref:ATP-binding protein n=1 Tax=Paenibacillus sp. BR1-192 TaxID=3032287 RepID=UPI00321A78EB